MTVSQKNVGTALVANLSHFFAALTRCPLSVVRFALWVAILGLTVAGLPACSKGSRSAEPARTSEIDSDPLQPIVANDLVVHVASEGRLREQVTARIGYLYQQYDIARLVDVHVDFFKEGSKEKDTLDAPEGYMYLRDDLQLTEEHPFYARIGGKEANIDFRADRLTSPALQGKDIPTTVTRQRSDIDLLGQVRRKVLQRKVVYRRSDGAEVTCWRAYRSTARSKLYGIGSDQFRCESRQPIPKKNTVIVQRGDIVITGDMAKSEGQPVHIRMLGETNEVEVSSEPIKPSESGP